MSNRKATLVSPQRFNQIHLCQFLSFLNIDLNEFLAYELNHLSSLLFPIEGARIVEGILEYFYRIVSFLELIMTFPKTKQCYKFELFILSISGTTLHELASSITFL